MPLAIWIVGAFIILFGFSAFFGAPYVPSRRRFLDNALTKLYPLGINDVLVDVGSGDGVVLRAAAEHGAKAVGYEINPFLVYLSRWLSRRQPLVSVRLSNFWLTPLPLDTTVVYAFAVTRDAKRLTQKLEREAIRLHRSLVVITLAVELPGITPVATEGPYFRYQIHPLQRS